MCCSHRQEVGSSIMRHSESHDSLKVCSVVYDVMDEEDMDDKEESEESRGVSVGRKKTTSPTLVEREEHERTHIPFRSWCSHCVAARASNPAHRGRKFAKAVEDDKDMKQVSYDYCVMRDLLGMDQQRSLCRKIALLAWCLLMWCP